MSDHAREVRAGNRFEFGANWTRFLRGLDASHIVRAENSLKDMLARRDLSGTKFLDAGSGSGLFSLAAHRLGAAVHSFDYDPQSVACTDELRGRFAGNSDRWQVERGSVLNKEYLDSLGTFDVVYSWGVLHHTGDQWTALRNIVGLVAPGGSLFIALYNDQGWISRYWTLVKRLYNRRRWTRALLVLMHAPYLLFGRFLARALSGRLNRDDRGMSLWYDMIDWLGGWPFEVSRPNEVIEFCRQFGLVLRMEKTVGNRQGCNEFVFARVSSSDSVDEP